MSNRRKTTHDRLQQMKRNSRIAPEDWDDTPAVTRYKKARQARKANKLLVALQERSVRAIQKSMAGDNDKEKRANV